MKNVIKSLKVLICSIFITLCITGAKVGGKDNKNETQIVQSSKKGKEKKKLIIENGILKEVDNDYQLKKSAGRKIGGTLTGTTYERHLKSTSIWLDNFEKKNHLYTEKLKLTKTPIIKEKKNDKNEKKINKKEFEIIFFSKIKNIIFTNFKKPKK
jgi:hypothetical protein